MQDPYKIRKEIDDWTNRDTTRNSRTNFYTNFRQYPKNHP